MKNNRRLVRAALIVCLAIVCLFSCVACAPATADDQETPSTTTTAAATDSSVTFTFKVVLEDKTTRDFVITTQETTLAKALAAEGIITYDPSGFYTVIDGVTASWDNGQAWWCITQNGGWVDYGLNDLPLSDGIQYEATYTIG